MSTNTYTTTRPLESLPGLLQAEVLDLARTSCTTRMLTQLCSACLALKPDTLVIFRPKNRHMFELDFCQKTG
ncbi:MAG: hypothetical protein PVH61_26165 [Candidatus Aminicenantes bacterium]|jgi:hypothetical protein